MGHSLDPRVHAFRDDIADIRLQGHVESRRFVTGSPGFVMGAIVNLHSAPDITSPVVTQALLGEGLTVFDTQNDWHWVQLDADSYVGYTSAHEVDFGTPTRSHTITATLAHVYGKPDIKSPPLEILPQGARLQAIGSASDTWLSLSRGGYVKTILTQPLTGLDYVSAAARLIGAPYLWGGRTALGIDCSGLVQLALQSVGKLCPRDSDQQAAVLGTELPHNAKLQRGDLIFFKGHVGIMWDETRLLHANAHTMNVAIEPLSDVEQREPVTTRRRIS
jgi:cell wall-associated NlpC family hydrolase